MDLKESKLLIIYIFCFLISIYTALAASCVGTNFNFTCGQTINESCTMDGNITCSGNGFIIDSNNLIVDGNGYNITGNNDPDTAYFGINATGRNNITIKNISVVNFGDVNCDNICSGGSIYLETISNSSINHIYQNNSWEGIYALGSESNIFYDLILTNLGSNGIKIDSGSNNNLSNINCDSNDGNGIVLYSSSNNYLHEITSTNNGNIGIALSTGSENNTLYNSTVINSNIGISVYQSHNNTFYNTISVGSTNSISAYESSNLTFYGTNTTENYYGLDLYDVHDSAFYSALSENDSIGIYLDSLCDNDFFINSVILNATAYDIQSYSGNHNLINTTYRKSNVSIIDGQLNFKWYLDIYVNDSLGNAIAGATLESYDKNNNLEATTISAVSGHTIQNITEYFQNVTGSYYLSNYTINASKSGYPANSTSVNITGNTNIFITLAGSNVVPELKDFALVLAIMGSLGLFVYIKKRN